jgi:alkyldihydroxyacetonephosphate synthase
VTEPTPPIAFGSEAVRGRFAPAAVLVSAELRAQLTAVCDVVEDDTTRAEAGRDWWPLAMAWALDGEVAQLPAVVCRPATAAAVAAVLAACSVAGVPVTPAGGRSGVCGASVPLYGGVLLDLTALAGVTDIDATSALVTVRPGTFGPDLEAAVRAEGFTVGHWPQSMDLSTVGGWLACRGAGQYSTRYGKIEDMVVGLQVALADGTLLELGGQPAGAQGPDLMGLFVGSEGTLGVITSATLRLHPAPPAERRAAFAFATFDDGLEACRRIIQRGATPAVLRLYDAAETARSYGREDCLLIVLDEGDATIIDAVMTVVAEECTGAETLDEAPVAQWLAHRNDVSGLEALTRRGFVIDTMEIAAPWSALPAIRTAATAALLAVPTARMASCHLSHSYSDGACLYFTFAATPEPADREATYVAMWDAGTEAVLAHGGNLSHHHGIGVNRARFLAAAPGAAVRQAIKDALDPAGVLNPGKLGLRHPFGEPVWP